MDASDDASATVLHTTHERGTGGLVADSWLRCRSRGVRRDDSRPPPLRWGPEELDAHRRAHPLASVLPLFRELLGSGAADDAHVFAVGDADGTLLWVEGDTGAMRRAERMRFVEGAVWSERQAGTNAPGTALELGRPVQIVTGEHYSAAVRAWSCAAAPVRDPATGRVLGVVDLSGGATIATPPALAAVRAAALAAEAQLARLPSVPLLGPDRGTAAPREVRLWALGRDSALLEYGDRRHHLSPRHSEIVLALALTGRGVTGDRLAVDLSERELPASTLRAEMTRLRAVLGPDLLGSRPYALLRPVRTDFDDMSRLLAEGRVGEALARYPGPLLPRSEAPAVVAHRRCLEQQLRGAVLGSGDTRLLRRWVEADWGTEDLGAWAALARALPAGSAQHAAAAARARALNLETAVFPQVRPYAAVLQRSRS
ncbi:GAF domain-containing protein [Streptomyces sp. ME18-1-4]|uniref:GAF domain-containing protein n=1 Tax=Streptomyces sp. ME18-1-4 TaxID=3028685 RepID=UPI0029BF15B6|nr:GAF domain-containing protein [Streptomyces sp. ME18-1-4]MDX3241369.1 GAF domain-containing protein [Streptomyces sp. ME18-1-4]